MSKIIVLNGIIGRGINGVSEIRITTNDKLDLTKPVIQFSGEIKEMDSYFRDHPLAGMRKFTVKTNNIIAVVE